MVTVSIGDGIDAVAVERGGIREIFATVLPSVPGEVEPLFGRVRRLLDDSQGEILEMRIFGTISAFPSCTDALQRTVGAIDWPLVYVEGEDCFASDVAGVQLHAVTGTPVATIRRDGWPIGRVFEDEFARYCVLGKLQSTDASRSREHQAQDTFQQMVGGLADAGMGLQDIVRTWFFVDDILGWYQDFNGVRSELYSKEGVFGRYLPASTGIGGRNPQGTSVVASALAMQVKEEGVSVQEIPSPLQCPAMSYGSSFSRAAELVTPDSRTVFVSGTASIDPEGITVHQDDVEAQVAYTMEIVAAILESRSMGFSDITRGNAYFKDSAAAVSLEEHASRHGLPLSRLVVSQNDVCRDDLLFELEVDATTTRAERS